MPLIAALVALALLAQSEVGVNRGIVTGTWARTTDYASLVKRDGALGYWRLGEPSGTTLIDSSGYGRPNGSYLAGVTVGVPVSSPDGDFAARFDGVDDRAQLVGMDLTGFTALTLEAWVNHEGQAWAATHEIVFNWGSSGTYIAVLDGRPMASFRIAGAQRTITAPSNIRIPTTGWHHLFATWASGEGPKVYLNLERVQAGNSVVGAMELSGNMQLGALGSSLWFKGLMDEVAVYGTVLTPQQIADHYAARQVQGRR